jgi:hypothetical protein
MEMESLLADNMPADRFSSRKAARLFDRNFVLPSFYLYLMASLISVFFTPLQMPPVFCLLLLSFFTLTCYPSNILKKTKRPGK